MRNKIISVAEAVDMIPDGATIMYGGFLGCGSAHHIIEALAQKGTKDLTIIGNDCGMATGPNGEEFYGVAKLVHNHQVKHVIATHVGMTPDVGTQGMVDKTLTVDLIPQGTLAEMIRAGGAGLGGGHDEREQTLNQLPPPAWAPSWRIPPSAWASRPLTAETICS